MEFQELCEVPLLAGYTIVLTLVLGAVFGSFLNCAAWRIVHHESVLKGRSHCATCGHPLHAADLVPVFSYLFLHGKCRYCGEKISPRYMFAELISAGLWLLCLVRYGLTPELVRAVLLVCILFTLSLVDLESYRIPNSMILALILVYAVTFPFIELGLLGSLSVGQTEAAAEAAAGVIGRADGPTSIFVAGSNAGSVSAAAVLRTLALPALAKSLGGALLLGGGLFIISLVFDRVTGKEGLGGGDIKLFFAAGLYLGALRGLLCVIVSCLIGLLFALTRRNQKIPFGPAISIGIILTLFWGQPLVDWYIGLL